MKTAQARREPALTVVWIVLIVVAVLWLNLPWNPAFQGLQSDSGVYAYIGSAIVHGQVPYRDVWEQKPPVGFYLDALAVLLFGSNPWGIWWLNSVWIVLATAAAFMVVKRLFGLLTGMITSVFFVVAVMLPELFQGGNLMEIYALLFQVTVVGATYAFFRTRRSLWILAAGILTGLALMTKQTTIGLGFACLGVILLIGLLRREWKISALGLAWFCLGLIVPVVMAVLYFLSAGGLDQFLDGTLLNSLSYVGIGAPFLWSVKHTALSVLPGLKISRLYLLAAAAFPLYLAGNAGWFFRRLRPTAGEDDASAEGAGSPVELVMLAVFVALPFEIVFASLGGRNFGHYFLTLIPAMTIAVGYLFWKAIFFLRKPRFGWKSVRFWTGTAAVLLSLGALAWLAGSVTGEIPTRVQLASFPKIFSLQTEAGALDKYILSSTGPQDRVLVWHIHLEINFDTGRRPPQRVLFPAQLFIPAGADNRKLPEFVTEMESNPPRLILVQKVSSIGLPFVNVPVDQMCPNGACIPELAAAIKHPSTLAELQKLRDYFLAHYAIDRQIDDWLIYKRLP